MARPFADIARDPRIIRGVHHYCDEWCDVCPVGSRCLAFRCLAVYRREKGRRDGDPTFRTPGDAVQFSRQLSAAEGGQPSDVDAMLASGVRTVGFQTADPLTRTAWQYALAVSMWLVLTPDELRRMRIGAAPSAEEVVLWYHLRIYMKLVRALLVADPAPGRSRRTDEANGLAKLTLVCVQRSRKALLQLKKGATETVTPLIAMMDALERGLDERFPDARAFIRPGLDGPVG